MPDSIREVLGRAARSYVVFVALGLAIGLTIAPVAFQAAESDGTVAVVPVAGAIDGATAADLSQRLGQARQRSDVKAVVVVANSGGGGAAASESLYLEMKRTNESMPVVASVDATAASGAYYAIAPSDRIYAKPASVMGSIGVLANTPAEVEPNDIVATTGPNKLTGGDSREFHYLLESLGESFYNAVEEQRGDRLDLSRREIAQARIYSGTQAVENGLADRIGDRRTAVRHAADLAGLDNYDVEVLTPGGGARFLARGNYVAADGVPADERRMVEPTYLTGTRGSPPTFLMVPGSYVVGADRSTNRTPSDPTARSPRNRTTLGPDYPRPAAAPEGGSR